MFWDNLFNKNKKNRPTEHSGQLVQSGTIKVVVMTDTGRVRSNNEDTGLFFRVADENVSREKGVLLMVADGMGGHQAGEVASKMATEIVSHEYFNQNEFAGIEKGLATSFATANKKIYEAAASNRTYQGMGTTSTALVVVDHAIFYAHVGDSRAYILKDKSISRLTEDHTYVQQLVKAGDITAKEAEHHPKRNMLTNAMGTKPLIAVDSGKCSFPFEEADRLLICSDGLHEYLNDDELKEILCNHTLNEAASIMIEQAKNRGGHDNITVVLAEKTASLHELPKETKDFDLPVTKEHPLP